MDLVKKIFGTSFGETIEELRKSLSDLELLKKESKSTSIEYKRIQKEWTPCKELISKSQVTSSLVLLDKKYDNSIKNLERLLQDLSDKQDKLKKSIINQISKNPVLFPLLFVDDFIVENKYNEVVYSMVKGHQQGIISDSQLKKLTVYKARNIEEEKVYIKDNRTQYADTIIIDDENNILFTVRNKQDNFCPSGYCLPGGHIEEGETPREAAQRELNEETGIELQLHELVPCGEYVDNKSHIYYFCAHSNVEPVVLQEEEQQQWEKVPFDEIDKKPLILNLQNNLEHLIAIPRKLLNKEADNAQKVYFDGKTFVKGKECLPLLYGMCNCSAIIGEDGRCSIYDENNNIEKASKSTKLVPKKIFITRGGRTFLTTVYVNPMTGEVDSEKSDSATEVEYISTDVAEGDTIKVRTARGWREGIVECLIKTKVGAYIGFRMSDGKYSEAYLKSIKELTKISSLRFSEEKKESLSKDIKEIKSVPNFSLLPTLGGSSETYLYDKEGTKYFIKKERPGKSGQLKSECLADKVYNAMGFAAPISDFHTIKDESTGDPFDCKISEYLSYQELGSLSPSQKEKAYEEIRKGFALDCLLSNWDVIGISGDNILVSPEGKVVRIDNGSAFEYRAKGSLKSSSDFLDSTEVVELSTMRTAGKAAEPVLKAFGSLTDIEISKQIDGLSSKENLLLDTLIENGANANVIAAIRRRLEYMKAWSKVVKDAAAEEAELIKKREEERLKWDKPVENPDMPSVVTEEYFKSWDSFELEGNSKLKESLRKGILETEKAREKGYERAAKELGMPIGAYKAKLQDLAERFIKVTYPGIVLHTSGSHEAFSKVFSKGGRFKALFETGTGCGCTRLESRSEYEHKVFGFIDDTKIDKDKRPVYGCASNNSRGFYGASEGRTASGYGDVFVEVKRDKAIKSATITTGDSLHAEFYHFPVPFGKPHFVMFSSVYDTGAAENIAAIEKYISGSMERISSEGSYIEMQYHNQLLQDDVDTIHIKLGEHSSTNPAATKVVQTLINLAQETGKAHKVDIYAK